MPHSYASQAKVSMTGYLFEDWLHWLTLKFPLFMDNAAVHSVLLDIMELCHLNGYSGSVAKKHYGSGWGAEFWRGDSGDTIVYQKTCMTICYYDC